MLAAWALRGYAERMVIVERDRYPERPAFRSGVPQARHAHLLLEAGHRALEALMPVAGVREELTAAGAVRVPISGVRWLSAAGWLATYESEVAFLSCTRPLLDHTVLRRVRGEPTVRWLENTDVVGLLGAPGEVTGVQVRARGDARAQVREVRAELVVDASGRTSSLPSWMTRLGRPPPRSASTRACPTSAGSTTAPPGRIRASPRSICRPRPLTRRGSAWCCPWRTGDGSPASAVCAGRRPSPVRPVSTGSCGCCGTRACASCWPGPSPPVRSAASGPAPVCGGTTSAGRRGGWSSSATPWCTFNPVYGQGITVAALGARALRVAAERQGGIGHRTAHTARKGIAAATNTAWMLSSSEDVRFPATTGGPAGVSVRAQHRYLDRVIRGATVDPRVCKALHEVMSLVAAPTALMRPAVLGAVLRGEGTADPHPPSDRRSSRTVPVDRPSIDSIRVLRPPAPLPRRHVNGRPDCPIRSTACERLRGFHHRSASIRQWHGPVRAMPSRP
ncbi:FAD-binding monooxygenase OS=Streptomyces antimycoticus OX=68175 GN=SSPO_092100 PE=4 SV=1 [Streptomyces antimycoticus]